MSDTFQATTDTNNKHIVQSEILYASWNCSAAVGGSEAPVEVKTALVGDGAKIEIKGKSSKGKAPSTINGTVMQNVFRGKLPIPERVDPDAEIWFEAKLSKHGLSVLSDRIPARPKFFIQTMQWDRSVVHRGDEVKMTIDFASGVEDGQEATVVVYEYNSDNNHDPVARFPVFIENNHIEIIWAFDYPGDVLSIPTQAELDPYGRTYTFPQYFFVVVVGGIQAGDNQESGLMTFKDTIYLSLVDRGGKPVPDENYEVTLADGTVVSGQLNGDGEAIITDISPGPYDVIYTEPE